MLHSKPQYAFILTAIVFIVPSVMILGYLGVLIEFLLSIAAYKFFHIGTPKQHPKAILFYALILFIGWLFLGLALLPGFAYVVQHSSMGR